MSRAAALLLLSLIALLAGCGGDGAALVLSGDYFPSAVGTSWQYRLETRVEVKDATFTGSGAMTREIVRTEPITVASRTVSAYVARDIYTVADVPDSGFPLTVAQRALVNLLFSSTAGGLRPNEVYYVTAPAATIGATRHSSAGISLNGGPILDILSSPPHFYNPPQTGEAHSASLPLIPMPLEAPYDRVDDPVVGTKLLDYADVDLALGSGHAAYYFEQYAGDLHYGPGSPSAFSGRGRLLMLEGVGLAEGDWTTTYHLDGWVRVSINLIGESYTPPAGPS